MELVFPLRNNVDNAKFDDDEPVYNVVKHTEGAKALCNVNSPRDIMTLMQIDGDRIVRLMANWKQKDVCEKMNAIRTFGCYELYIYVKRHDSEFFEKYLREYIQDQHIGQNIYKAYLLDDTEFLREKSK